MQKINFKTAIAAMILSGAMVIFSSCENNDEEIAKLENQIKHLQSQSNENFPFLEEKLTKLQSELTKSKNQLTSVNNKLLDIDELEFLLNGLSTAIDSLKSKPNPTMAEIEGLEAELQKIKDEFFTEFQTTGKHAGHDWVDLGTTVLWATCNIGANKPEECGELFRWGSIESSVSYMEDGRPSYANYEYFDENYEIYNSTSGLTELKPEHDAATQNWGGNWRMPTPEDFDALINICTRKNITESNGVKYTSSLNGKSIFLPVAGYYGKDNYWGLNHYLNYSYYWTRTLDYSEEAYCFTVSSNYNYKTFPRTNAISIRPVLDKEKILNSLKNNKNGNDENFWLF